MAPYSCEYGEKGVPRITKDYSNSQMMNCLVILGLVGFLKDLKNLWAICEFSSSLAMAMSIYGQDTSCLFFFQSLRKEKFSGSGTNGSQWRRHNKRGVTAGRAARSFSSIWPLLENFSSNLSKAKVPKKEKNTKKKMYSILCSFTLHFWSICSWKRNFLLLF